MSGTPRRQLSVPAPEPARSARPPLPPGPYLVVGLGRSGRAVAELLSQHDRVVAYDANPALAGVDTLKSRAEVHLGGDGRELLVGVRTVVKSPGVPREAPVVVEALRSGRTVIGELEVAWRLLPNECWAVTGTNGKTTTVELLGAILRAAGREVVTAGNVGRPLAALVGRIGPETTLVVEASSFQIEDTIAFCPDCAVLLNLGVDHLDRHGTVEAYHRAKLRLFEHQGPSAVAVAPVGVAVPGGGRRIAFGAAGSGAELEFSEEGLCWRGEPLVARSGIRLRGQHNLENAAAAAAAALACGVSAEPLRTALASFEGVPHRLEEVARIGGVLFVNDSKATNVESTVRALEAFPDGGLHLIAGGRPKGGGFRALRPLVAERCRAVYAVGEASEELVSDLSDCVPVERCGTLERALERAVERARPGETVLLSPACASFDQFRDFEARGERFKELVRRLSASAGAVA